MNTKNFHLLAVGFAFLLSGFSRVIAQTGFPPLALKPISLTQIVSPVSISNAGDGSNRLFVCDQGGQIWIIRDEMVLPTPFLNLSSKIVPKAPTSYLFPLSASYDERGLLGLAFHPNFNKRDSNNVPLPGYGKFYVFYSAPSPNVVAATDPNPVNCRSTISEFQVSALNHDVADPSSERILLAYDKPQSNHNGGQLQFGPDGYLYFSAGDGGGQYDNENGHTGGSGITSPGPSGVLGNAQDKTKLLGKILRIDVLGTNGPGGQYGIPATNPFVGAGGGVREEIYAYGVRNPWRFSFDDGPGGSGRLFEGDVGQDKVEEVNIIVAGGNYGWRAKEGSFFYDSTAPTGGLPLIDPIAQYAHIGITIGSPALPQIGASVIGGYVYRGSAIPSLTGKYIFGDYSHSIGSATGTLLGLEETPSGSGVWALSQLSIVGGNPLATRIQAFGRDEQGELYVATKVTMGPFQLDATGKPTGGIYKIVAAQVSTSTLNPSKDNSMFSELTGNSDAGGKLTSGRSNVGNLRRALLAFDISGQLPAGAVVTSAQLTLNLNQTAATSAATMSLSKLTQDWGEGTSDPLGNAGGAGVAATAGDATWTDSFYDASSPTLWGTPGGSYASTASASATVGNALGLYSWTSPQLAADVQAWRNTPSSNYGWILIGDEASNQSARRFDSRESAIVNLRPTLVVNYNPVQPALSRRESWLRQYFPTPGTYVDDLADYNNDGTVNLLEYAFALSPLASNPPTSNLQISQTRSGANSIFTTTFRRDPRATDLTYILQASSDLVTWTTLLQSVAGAVPTGSGFVSEADAPGESPVKVVSAMESLPAPAKRFVRLQVIRAY